MFSFHPRKFITTGEGGLITTGNAAWAEWMTSYKHFGMATATGREGTVFTRLGTNAKLSNILAAVGLGQMAHIDALLARRTAQAQTYIQHLQDHPGLRLQRITPHGTSSWQTFALCLPCRDAVLAHLRAGGIEAQIGTYALHTHPAFAPGPHVRYGSRLHGSREAFDTCLVLPLYHAMTEEDQARVVAELLKAVVQEEGG